MNQENPIAGGVYLIIDPSDSPQTIHNQLEAALSGGLSIVQIWNKWPLNINKDQFLTEIGQLCKRFRVPCLINEEWKLLIRHPELSGIHFNEIPPDYQLLRQLIGRDIITGITCGNDMKNVIWARANRLNYVSFCSIFPSDTAGSCELIMPAVVQKTRLLTDMPIFVAGGITPTNIGELGPQIPFDGVAVISGIMSSADPEKATRDYSRALEQKALVNESKGI